MRFTWNKDISVHIDLIDEQHQNYFNISNRLFDLMQMYTEKDERKLHILFDELLNYAFYHLASEESFFEECHYEETDAHVKEHDAYRKKMIDFRQKIRESDTDKRQMGLQAQIFATSWLIEHVKITDMRYVPTLTKCFNARKLHQQD